MHCLLGIQLFSQWFALVALIVKQMNVEYEVDNPLLLAMKVLVLIFEVKRHLRHHLTKHHHHSDPAIVA